MITLVTGDLHLNDNPRDQYRHAFQPYLRQLIVKYKVDRLVLLGDFTDHKDHHSSWLVNKVVDYIVALAKLCEVIGNRGNHDYLDPDNPFFKFLGHLNNVRWINTPQIIDGDLFLPHTRDPADWQQFKGKYRLAYMHQTFHGTNGGGFKLRGLPLEMIPRGVDRAVSGDVHIPQTFEHVTYCGAPYTINFGDTYQPRVLLIDDSGGFRSIYIKGPQKRLLTVRDGLLDFKVQPNPGDIVKVEVPIEMADVANWATYKKQIKAMCIASKFHVHSIQPIVTYETGEKPGARRPQPRKSDETIVREFANRSALDKDTLQAGLNITEAV